MGENQKINVSKFLKGYKSKNTRRAYLSGLKKYFEFIYPDQPIQDLYDKAENFEEKAKSLDLISEQYLAEDRDITEDIFNLSKSLEDSSPTTQKARINLVRTWLEINYIEIPKAVILKIKRENGKTEALSIETIPQNEEIKRIIEYLPIHGKALTLFLASSGMRIGEATGILPSDIDFDSDLVKINVRAEIAKTGKRRITFISPEAKEALVEWLNYRDQYVETANARSQLHEREESDRIFPFNTTNFNYIWNNALEKAGLMKRDPKTNRVTMRPHNLRKYFRLRVGRFGRDEAECLMGHQQGLNAIYARYDGREGSENRLREVYVESINELSIYKQTKELTTIKKELDEKNVDLQQSLNIVLADNVRLRGEIDKINARVQRFEAHVKRIIEHSREVDKKLGTQLKIDLEEAERKGKEEAEEQLEEAFKDLP